VLQVQIETTTHCNARCVFCYYPHLKRPKGTMSMDLFKKIIDEIVDLRQITEMSFQGLGEPLIDSHIVSRVAYAHKKLPWMYMSMFTNGSLLTLGTAKMLNKAGLSRLYVSLNSNDTDQREQIMGLKDYETVSKTCREILDANLDMKVNVKAVVATDFFAGEPVREFERRWVIGDIRECGRNHVHLEGNWGGHLWKARTVKNEGCQRALSQIMILWDGRVVLCCFDCEGENVFGDLNHQTIKEIYSNPIWVKYRELSFNNRRNEILPCRSCTGI